MLEDKGFAGTFAPSYYNEFKCIADKCKHSCCIGWEIYIDDAAYLKYKNTDDILPTVKECRDGACFSMRADGRCPHLNTSGLCDIIIKHGEGYLCEICRNHPRFFNFINEFKTEAGLGIVCEEACRMILESDKPFELFKIEGSAAVGHMHACSCEFDALSQRNSIINVLKKNMSYDDKVLKLKKDFKIPECYTPDEWLDLFLSLEILDSDWEKDLRAMRGRLLLNRSQYNIYDKYYTRLLTYFVYRHISVAQNENELRARLGFCILSVEVIRSLFEESERTEESLIDISRRYSAEIEYSEDNTEEVIFVFESELL